MQARDLLGVELELDVPAPAFLLSAPVDGDVGGGPVDRDLVGALVERDLVGERISESRRRCAEQTRCPRKGDIGCAVVARRPARSPSFAGRTPFPHPATTPLSGRTTFPYRGPPRIPG